MNIIKYSYGESLSLLKQRLPFSKDGCVMALGFFDGVHIAHRALIAKAKKEAMQRNLPLVIFTFSGKDSGFKKSAGRIYTDEEKCSLLEECDADYIILCDFAALSEFSKENFISEFLVDCTNTRVAVFGFNFRFGKDAEGNASDLRTLLSEYGRDAIEMENFLYRGKSVSSTEIRELIKNGDLSAAAKLLGKPYLLSGSVSHGLGIGTGMGLPTINTEIPNEKFTPPNGVYATRVKIEDAWYSALTNIGTCPTFGERELHTETFILDFDGNVYGSSVKIYLVDFLREERMFSSKEELIMQINIDKTRTKEIVRNIKWQEIGLS